ncbi:DUF6261 family protein [uncultured Treponema sp.]|uniref:DUF6261 family protein n=1 Tax=uncultured Treponema sp. TaxID=162155 RepID=UPI0025939F28|nr:DUF6261 family protein [uncultured Treponema sp.]
MNKMNAKARVTEVDALSDALVRLYKADTGIAEDAFLKTVMAEVETLSAQLTTAIRQDKVLSSLEEADGVRDEAVKSLGTLLDGYAAIPIASKKEAAEKLRTVFVKYGKSITTANYASESSLIESLLEDFSKADAQESAKVLDGVAEILEQIRTAQDAFVKASDEYTAASSAKAESATSLKKPLVSAINDRLVPYITAMTMANGTVYGDFAAKAEKEISRVNETVSRRGK